MIEREPVEPRILKGFRDIDPPSMRRRNYIIRELVKVFEIYQFLPLETPTLEYLDVLTGKMGEETDKQIYAFEDAGGREIGLRYELTVSLARYIAMNPYVKMPFKRYQVEKVFRAEKPQKGRFREFTQCDVDIVGTDSVYADSEIISILADGMESLGIEDYQVLINDREVLTDLFNTAGIEVEEQNAVSRIIDKLDKVGIEGVFEELEEKGFLKDVLKNFLTDFSEVDETEESFELVLKYLSDEESLVRLKDIFKRLSRMKPDGEFVFAPTLARGLDYYTGPVFEVVIPELNIGSVAGGGRYDNLIGSFLGKQVPAVGTSFGLDRIEITLEEMDLFPEKLEEGGVFVTVFGVETEKESLSFIGRLREARIPSDIYPGAKNIGKQFGYADAKGYSYCVIIGPDEIERNQVKIKDMKTGDEEYFDGESALRFLKEKFYD